MLSLPLSFARRCPLDTNGKADKENGNNSGGHNNLHSSSFSPQPAVQISFEPLTSPALNAEPSTIKSKGGKKNHKETDDRRRSTSSAYALVKMRTNNTNVELLMERQFCKVIQAMLPRSMVVVNHTSHQLQKWQEFSKAGLFFYKSV